MPDQEIKTQCCIAGGGPAGVMLGFLLARAGVEVVVLEKWPDFFRDFRGDTIHPSTMDVLYELGLLDEFLALDHSEARVLKGYISGKPVVMGDFSHLPTRCKFIALIPQWDFLSFITDHARRLPAFRILMRTEATDLIAENGRVVGVRAHAPDGDLAIRADLVVGADGRHSTMRAQSGLAGRSLGAPMDVLWLRLSRAASDPDATFGRLDNGKILVMINRDEYWQCGMVIKKGAFAEVQGLGLAAFHRQLVELAPFLADRVHEIAGWQDVKLLSVAVDRLDTWYRPGLLCIGDAAHAMSPIGGIGINLAIQDAVAAANLLAPRFKAGGPATEDLAAVQRRREPPTRRTQRLQLFVQDRMIAKVLGGARRHYKVPWVIQLLQWFPVLRRIPARIVGIGFRAEHVRV